MTQRTFDINNENDMKDLWDILPDNVYLITKEAFDTIGILSQDKEGGHFTFTDLIKINWNDKEKISRDTTSEKQKILEDIDRKYAEKKDYSFANEKNDGAACLSEGE